MIALDPAAAEANQAYGELTGHLDDAAYAFERAMGRLELLFEGGAWRKVGRGFDHPEPFVRSLPLAQFGKIIDQRQRIAELIKTATDASNRAIADALGVDHVTIGKDLAGDNSPASQNDASETNGERSASGDNSPPGQKAGAGANRKERRAKGRNRKAKFVPAPLGKYDVAIIDPPWPMEKIDRDVRPNQAEVDYRTMDEDGLRTFGETIKAIAADDCHLFLWATQRFLPLAFRLIDEWGFRYGGFVMGWHKPGGFQPVGLPQFNLEHVVYGRRGLPAFVDTKAFPACFDGARREHFAQARRLL